MLNTLATVEDEFIVPDNISILQYSLSDNDSTIVRSVEVAPTDVFKYYSEYDNDNVYTLAVYDLSGNLKHKAYTTSELANSPIVDIKYGADINNLNPDEYNGYINGSTTTSSISNKIINNGDIVPNGIYKLICFPDTDTENKFYISVSPGDKIYYYRLAPEFYSLYAFHLEADNSVDVNKVRQYIINKSFIWLRANGNDAINKCGITTKPNLNDYICSYIFDSDAGVTIPAGVKYYYCGCNNINNYALLNQMFSEIADTSVQHIFNGEYVTSEHEVYMYLDSVKVGSGHNDSKKLYWYILYIKE